MYPERGWIVLTSSQHKWTISGNPCVISSDFLSMRYFVLAVIFVSLFSSNSYKRKQQRYIATFVLWPHICYCPVSKGVYTGTMACCFVPALQFQLQYLRVLFMTIRYFLQKMQTELFCLNISDIRNLNLWCKHIYRSYTKHSNINTCFKASQAHQRETPPGISLTSGSTKQPLLFSMQDIVLVNQSSGRATKLEGLM